MGDAVNGWVIVVEGNFASFGCATLARQRGYAVEVLVRDLEPYGAHLPPVPAVDRVTVVETLDPEVMRGAIGDRPVAAVICATDAWVGSAAALARSLGCPGPTPAAARRASRKDECRATLRAAGMRQPPHVLVTDPDAVLDPPFPGPFVVKPVNDSGSRGVTLCPDLASARRALTSLRGVSRSFFGAPLEPRWLVEGYVEGPELSAELFWAGGRWNLLGFTQKRLTPPPRFIESGHRFPAPLPPGVDGDRVRARITSWLDAIGLDFGFAHVEFRLVDNEPVLIEVNPRLGGGRIPTLIREVLGLDPLALLLDAALGRSGALGDLTPRASAAIGFVIPPRPGTVVAVDGLDRAAMLPGVLTTHLGALPRTFASVDSNGDRMGYVLATAGPGGDPFLAVDRALGALDVRFAEPA